MVVLDQILEKTEEQASDEERAGVNLHSAEQAHATLASDEEGQASVEVSIFKVENV